MMGETKQPAPEGGTGVGRLDVRRVFPFMAVAVCATQIGMGIITPILPVYAKDLGATGLWIGIIASSYAISRAVFMPPFGWLSDRRGRKIFLGIGLLATSLLSFAYIYAGDVQLLTVVRGLHGMFSAMIIPIATAYVGEISPEGQEGKWMGYFNTAFFVGFGTGPILGGVVADRFGIPVAFNIMGFLNLVAFLSVLIFLPNAKAEKARRRVKVPFSKMFESRMVWGLFGHRTVYEASMGAATAFLPIYAGVQLGMDKTQIGILVAANMLLMSVFQIWTGPITDKFNRRYMIIATSVVTYGLLVTMTLATTFWVLLGVMAARSVVSSFSMPAVSAISVQEGRKFGMGSTTSVLGVATSAGMAVGPLASGPVADAWNVEAVFYFAAALGVVGTVWFTLWSRGYQRPAPARPATTEPVTAKGR